jgi:hypothetical protein
MGVTLTVAAVFWLASSYIEYKIVKSFPATRKIIQHPVGGILLSVAIGFCVSLAIGSQGGLGIFIGQILGLATNNFTFQLYSALGQLNTAGKELLGSLRDFWHSNVEAVKTVGRSIMTICRGIAMIIRVLLWPFKALNWMLSRSSATS